jgi:hypothetical protein
MTLLDDIIDGSTDELVSTTNLLRKVQIAASRVGAEAVTNWARSELNGYDPSSPELLPGYRAGLALTVEGHFEGPMGTSARGVALPGLGLPDWFFNRWFRTNIFQPLSELEMLAASDGDTEPQVPWTPEAVFKYRQWGSEGKAGRMEMMELFEAGSVFPRTAIHGMVQQVRNKALEFALEMQSADPSAGTVGGPTIDKPEISSAVTTTTINIYGHGTNVASGSHIRQRSTVSVGDIESLKVAAQALGLSAEVATEFAEIIAGDRDIQSDRARGFLERVRRGAISLGGNVSANLAASGLIDIASQFLG